MLQTSRKVFKTSGIDLKCIRLEYYNGLLNKGLMNIKVHIFMGGKFILLRQQYTSYCSTEITHLWILHTVFAKPAS